jgi:hypothetical protein
MCLVWRHLHTRARLTLELGDLKTSKRDWTRLIDKERFLESEAFVTWLCSAARCRAGEGSRSPFPVTDKIRESASSRAFLRCLASARIAATRRCLEVQGLNLSPDRPSPG